MTPPAAARAASGPRGTFDQVTRWFSWAAGGLALALMLLIVAEVGVRAVVGRSLSGTIELSEVLLVFIVALGIGNAQRTGAHVNTDLLTSRLTPHTGAVVRVAGLTVAAGFLLWTTWVSATRGWEAMLVGEARFGISEVPVWPARLVLPLGLLVLSVQCLLTARDAWGRRHGSAGTAGEGPDDRGSSDVS
ncbi:TRAP transporter small permease subunit [Pseudonocardia parietis]|uniref:TRAP-type C4-dicarboxylate transport system permease small subunit n=1 Tax=Pseudonocardia parietis TaxID=570936 RepID=A0ABS4VR17_9PSEU|nr:TRAP transporter small permease [Pseudonocardia parietis]MBP2366188.1 TRAP-type C4-dicarboxylate transport system permease small subunit [Pseudonocardia parietis]